MGCSDDPAPPDDGRVLLQAGPDADLFDFGPVLARGQTLRHEFTLSNPSGLPVRLLGVEPMTPCCSAVESIPGVIPPRSSAKLAVTFNPGFQSGRRRARFIYGTDQNPGAVRELTLVASLFPEVEERPGEGMDTVLPIGREGRLVSRFVIRRQGSEGRGKSSAVTMSPPLSGRLLNQAETTVDTKGLREVALDVEVALPASADPGARHGEMTLHWPDGRTWQRTIEWKVVPRIVAKPAGLVIHGPGVETRTIALKSSDRPFRILRVAGEGVMGGDPTPIEASMSHELQVRIDAEWPRKEGVFDIQVVTDHPDQPSVLVKVLLSATRRGDHP